MKDLIDLHKGWRWFVSKAKESLGWLIALAVFFFLGMAWAYKDITDDCKFMGAFRDGPFAYNCNQRIK